MAIKILKQQLIISYEVKYDDQNDWYVLDEETSNIDSSKEVTTSEEIAKQLLHHMIHYAEKMALQNIQDISCEEVNSLEETIVSEVKEYLGLDQEGDLPDEYSSLVRSVLIKTSLSDLKNEEL